MKKQLIIYLLITFCSLINAQEHFNIVGKIINSDNTPINNSTIIVLNSTGDNVIQEVKSTDGVFNISINNKNTKLIIGANSYQSKNIKISDYQILNNTIQLGSIVLTKEKIKEIQEIVIQNKTKFITKQDGKTIYNIDDAMANSAGSISNLLGQLPSITSDIDGNIKIRGKETKVQINGRTSNLTKAEVLKILPSNMISKIEVNTNPDSSESGSEPIINIITKKTNSGKINGGLNASVGIPETLKGSGQILISKDKFNIYSVIGANNTLSKGYDNETLKKTSIIDIEKNTINKKVNNYFGEIGIETTPNDDYSFFGSSSFYINNSNTNLFGDRVILQPALTNKNIQQENIKENNILSFEQNIEYKKFFKNKKQALEIELKYEYGDEQKKEKFNEVSESNKSFSYFSETKKENILELEIDFKNNNFKNIFYSIGGEIQYNKLSLLQNIQNTELAFNEFFNHDFNLDFSQFIHSSYIRFRQKINKKFNYGLGFRSEFLDKQLSYLNDNNTNVKINNNLFNILPFFSANYEINKDNSIDFKYSNRVKYPRLSFLIPYNTSLDRQNIKIGNPDLDVQKQHDFEIEYTINSKKINLSTSLYYHNIKNMINYVTTTSSNGYTTTFPINTGKSNILGMDLFIGRKHTSWLTTNINMNYSFNKIYSPNFENKYFKLDGSISNYLKIKPFYMELSWLYYSPRKVTFQQKNYSIQYFKLATSYEIFNGKGTLSLSLIDPFNSNKSKTTIIDTNLYLERDYFPNQRQILLSFFYRFDKKRKMKEKSPENQEIFIN